MASGSALPVFDPETRSVRTGYESKISSAVKPARGESAKEWIQKVHAKLLHVCHNLHTKQDIPKHAPAEARKVLAMLQFGEPGGIPASPIIGAFCAAQVLRAYDVPFTVVFGYIGFDDFGDAVAPYIWLETTDEQLFGPEVAVMLAKQREHAVDDEDEDEDEDDERDEVEMTAAAAAPRAQRADVMITDITPLAFGTKTCLALNQHILFHEYERRARYYYPSEVSARSVKVVEFLKSTEAAIKEAAADLDQWYADKGSRSTVIDTFVDSLRQTLPVMFKRPEIGA